MISISNASKRLLRPKLFLVTVLILTMTFEDFILKWLPVSDTVYSYSRFLSEFSIYALFLYFVVFRLARTGVWRKTKVDLPLLGFVIIALASIVINDAPILGSLVNFRVLIRYALLFYVILNLDLEPEDVRLMFISIMVIAVIQSLIGILQTLQGGATDFWLPRPTTLEVAGYSKEFTALTGGTERGSVIGAFGYPVSMALFLMIAIICVQSLLITVLRPFTLRWFLGLLALTLMIIALLLTYSRAAVVAVCLATPILLWLGGKSRLLFKCILALGAAAFFIGTLFALSGPPNQVGFVKVREHYVSPMGNLSILLSPEYWERTQASRQWVIREVGGTLIRQGSFVGFSPDEQTAKAEIAQRAGGTLSQLISYRAFEDVYWVAVLAYYGFAGLGLYLLVLWLLFRIAASVAKSTTSIARPVGIAFGTLLIVTIPLTLIVQTFEFRVFGFYFWLLAALTYTEYRRTRQNRIFYADDGDPVTNLSDPVFVPTRLHPQP